MKILKLPMQIKKYENSKEGSLVTGYSIARGLAFALR